MGIGTQRQSTYVPTVAPPVPTIAGGLTPVKLGDTRMFDGEEYESDGVFETLGINDPRTMTTKPIDIPEKDFKTPYIYNDFKHTETPVPGGYRTERWRKKTRPMS